MENQHQKIKGYRELSQVEIDLMNEIKEHGELTKKLLDKVFDLRAQEQEKAIEAKPLLDNEAEILKNVEDSIRCLSIAHEHLQTGQMWLVRSVALPESF